LVALFLGTAFAAVAFGAAFAAAADASAGEAGATAGAAGAAVEKAAALSLSSKSSKPGGRPGNFSLRRYSTAAPINVLLVTLSGSMRVKAWMATHSPTLALMVGAFVLMIF
jgi:hypothetical protein